MTFQIFSICLIEWKLKSIQSSFVAVFSLFFFLFSPSLSKNLTLIEHETTEDVKYPCIIMIPLKSFEKPLQKVYFGNKLI